MSDPVSGRRLTHFGLLVSDIERSTRFYCDALGFEPVSELIVIGQEFSKLSGAAGDAKTYLRFIRRDEVTIELLCSEAAPVTGRPARDRLGLWHLCLNVADIDAEIARIRAHGGAVREETRTVFDLAGGKTMEIVYCSDPDGQPVELTNIPDGVLGDYQAVSEGRAR
jgi:catechol 2,3-dioxygenase-like lactoylglutathione lyase family enzyme